MRQALIVALVKLVDYLSSFNIKNFLQPFKEAAINDEIEKINKTFEGIKPDWNVKKAGLFAHTAFAEDLVTQTISSINQSKFADFARALGKII